MLPTAIIADTIKGRGVSFMEHTTMSGRWYRYHSGAPTADDYERAITELAGASEAMSAKLGVTAPAIERQPKPAPASAPSAPQRLVKAYGEALMEEATRTPRLVALDADLVLDTGLIPFSEKFPDRFIECGIAEMDMVSQASGLALSGFLPVVHSFACFLTPRANEQIFNADSEKTRIIYVGSLAGAVPGGAGHSHQSVRDIALMGSLPNTTMIEPCCETEVAMAVRWAVRDNPGSTYLRLVSIPVDVPYALPTDYRLEPGKGVVLADGKDVVVFAYGPILLGEAWRAAKKSAVQGLSLRIINMPWLGRFDDGWLASAVAGCKAAVCLDNHFVWGGQGERIAARLAVTGHRLPVRLLGLTEIPTCGRNDEVLRYHGLDAVGIMAATCDLLGR
jgi:transketolase